jgi:3-phenylpropionate/cinnamic acid dioxygenase small subunit
MNAPEMRTRLRSDVEDLLYLEARLLDEKKWREWLELYAEDAVFWMPAWASEYETTSDPELELNLVYLKGRQHLEDRVFRLETGDSFASVPMARTVHLVGSVTLTGTGGDAVSARASWIVHCYGLHGPITRGGWYEYQLRQTDAGLKIGTKKITMIDDKLVGPVDFFHV